MDRSSPFPILPEPAPAVLPEAAAIKDSSDAEEEEEEGGGGDDTEPSTQFISVDAARAVMVSLVRR